MLDDKLCLSIDSKAGSSTPQVAFCISDVGVVSSDNERMNVSTSKFAQAAHWDDVKSWLAEHATCGADSPGANGK